MPVRRGERSRWKLEAAGRRGKRWRDKQARANAAGAAGVGEMPSTAALRESGENI
jgi:hypothetical protein